VAADGLQQDVDATLTVDQGQLALEWRASGGYDGSLGGTVKLLPAGDGAADLSVEVSAKSLRAGLAAGEGVDPREVPPTSLELKSGAPAAEPARNGRVLLAMGPGKVRSASKMPAASSASSPRS
jgi:hypothetical protein